jgi:hypothetical protein
MALTFGSFFDFQTFFSLAGLVSIAGLVALAVVAFVKPELLTGILQVISQLFGTFLSSLGRMLSYAPKFVRVLFFLFVGGALLGTMVNFFLSMGYVCATEGIAKDASTDEVYESNWFSASMASMLSNYVETTPHGSLAEGTTETNQSPSVSSTVMDTGSRILAAQGSDSWASSRGVQPGNAQYYILLPDFVSTSVLVQPGYSRNFVVCKNEDSGNCSIREEPIPLSECNPFTEDYVGTYTVSFMDSWWGQNSVLSTVEGVVHQAPDFSVSFDEATLVVDKSDLCPQTVEDVSNLFVPMKFSEDQVSSTFLRRDDIRGFVGLIEGTKYVKLESYVQASATYAGGTNVTVVINPLTGSDRWRYIVQSGAFVKSVQSEEDMLARVCEEDDTIGVRFYGVNVFSWELLMTVMIGVALVQMLRWLF